MELIKKVSEIKNVTVKSGAMYVKLTRTDSNEFEVAFRSDEDVVCSKCGEIIAPGKEDLHIGCSQCYYDIQYVIDTVNDLFIDDDDNIIAINEGYPDQRYIKHRSAS